MSKYTTEVRYICEVNSGLSESVGYSNVEEVIENSREKIFDFDYPIFDENYRSLLECKILRHYYTREIGFETVSLWKLKLNMKLNDIMPYYNQLYKSELLDFNPLYDTDITIDHQKVDNGNRNTTGSGEYSNTTDYDSTKWDYYNDTPQGSVSNLDDLTYLTNARKDTADDTTENTGNNSYTDTSTIKNVQDYLEHIKGKRSGTSYSKLLSEYRETFLNIDLMIIEELKDLFMYLW